MIKIDWSRTDWIQTDWINIDRIRIEKITVDWKRLLVPGLLLLFFIIAFILKIDIFYVNTAEGRVFLRAECFAVILALVAFFALFFLPDRWQKPEILFWVLGLGGGIAFAIITPLCQECDGYTHLYRSMDISYGNLFSSFVDLTHKRGYVEIPANFYNIRYEIFNQDSGRLFPYVYNLKNLYFSTETILMEYPEGAFTFFYWPQALGLAMGRWLCLSVYQTGILAHLFNLFTYMIFTWLALRNLPIYKNLLMILAVSPLALFQAASFSPDALLNGLCFLFVALCFKYAYTDEEVGLKQVVWLGILLGVISICKYIYVCLGILVFIIPVKKLGSRKEYRKALLVGFGIVFITFALQFYRIKGIYDVAINSMGVGEGENAASQLKFLLSHPKWMVVLMGKSFLLYVGNYVDWMNTLGSLNYWIGFNSTFGPLLFAVVAFLDVNENNRKLLLKDRIIMIVTSVVTLFILYLAMYVFDAKLNSLRGALIQGVQGRYFFPFLLLPFAAVGSPKVKQEISRFSLKCIALQGFMLVYAVMYFVQMCYR